MADGALRYVANLKFGTLAFRLYLRLAQGGDGDSALQQALLDVDRVVGPQARDVADFLARSRKTFADYGFVELRA